MLIYISSEAVARRCSVKKVYAYAYNFIKKEALAQVFSCAIYEIFKNAFFIEHLRWLILFL